MYDDAYVLFFSPGINAAKEQCKRQGPYASEDGFTSDAKDR